MVKHHENPRKKIKFEKKREVLVFLFIIISIITTILILNYEKNCGFDNECMQKSAQKCTRASLYRVEESNILKYQIMGKDRDNCGVKVTVERVSPLASYETQQLFEGKSMTCSIPKTVEIQESKEIIAYCTGPLKEAIYELIIKKIYNYVALNLGELISELK